MLRSRLPVRLGYALVYPDRLSRHLARQHQLGIFVYRGLDVHALTQQCQTSGQVRCRSFGRLDRNNARIGRRFSELWHHLLHGGVYRCDSRSTTDA